MLKKSLYLRIVATFIGVVLISLFVSYTITSNVFQPGVLFEEEITNVTKGAANVLEMTDVENVDEMIDTLKDFHFDVLIVNEEGETFTNDRPFDVDGSAFQEVISSEADVPVVFHEDAARVGGVPLEIGQEQYALFVHMDYEEEGEAIRYVISMALLIVLICGSLLIFLASRYVVDPIKKLTTAAKEMAKGNFSIRLKNKNNQDEVGELIRSFNHMASEVEQIDKMRDDFVSSVSHEFQSPLTSIRGFTKAIRDDVVPKKNQKEYLDIIYEETQRLSRLSENLLQLASLESDHYPLKHVKYRLDEQFRRAVLATEPLWKKKQLGLELNLDSVEVKADEDLLNQVWVNLLANAIKYSPQGETLTCTLKEIGKNIEVSIEDNGKGIPEEEIPHLFNRFYKVDKARSSSIEGNGLGLSIVKKILSIHNFDIQVTSEHHKGSTFTVVIPLDEN
ncbi:two-component sensor histidine kinase [Salipaludibacillus keqinensis]|uniref:Heme sensor protein HssS n=1 Tax=Salipaludibacillus keqinensis TaxID=2045207 RepID=A0A323TJ25_9BACI|nr:HAMP domain-containing sensor histidine kinase [Salipaludibacillus keqinensis]PYZ94719.1 two-component sensor histidine kinase [Salipaludibacillus keqinensis]